MSESRRDVARFALLATGGISALALAIALVLQYGFGQQPCHLCILERWPYLAAAVLALLGLLTGWIRAALLLAGLVLLGNAGLSAYHVGVEQGWFALPDSCVGLGAATSVEDLRARILAAAPTCDQVQVTWLGLSLAAWNALLALLLGCVALIAGLRRRVGAPAPATR